jgi:hypothetical protein
MYNIRVFSLVWSWLGDSASTYQLGFQDPATTQMEGIFFLIFICCL